MIVVHKTALAPNNAQRAMLAKSAGVARFAYNWALAEWQRQRARGEKPTEGKLRRQLNAIKRSEFPWMLDVPKTCPQQAMWDYRFIWCLYAISWGIRQFDAQPAVEKAEAA
jgi:putative transposase